ncbi:hypothetical protein KSP40_PGU020153 [Platanthera guangdongensis]|uniref:RRM domain-containing protein n=1 Tax=Platanthera guangdongensis TaxID=2320717 RepID=A0ABR2MWY9_9ASPA
MLACQLVIQTLSEEGIESRTVLVSNVHFAATKESLISHFGRCGTIAKVVMLTDAVTGLPKGGIRVQHLSDRLGVNVPLFPVKASFVWNAFLTTFAQAQGALWPIGIRLLLRKYSSKLSLNKILKA